jgi:hypothetical protein
MANVENLKIIRLLSGEEIMAEVVTDSGTALSVKNAIRIVVMPNSADPKAPTVGLAPFMQFSEDKELTLNKNCVITTATPMKEFVNQYNTVFGGIVVPDSKLIVPGK